MTEITDERLREIAGSAADAKPGSGFYISEARTMAAEVRRLREENARLRFALDCRTNKCPPDIDRNDDACSAARNCGRCWEMWVDRGAPGFEELLAQQEACGE